MNTRLVKNIIAKIVLVLLFICQTINTINSIINPNISKACTIFAIIVDIYVLLAMLIVVLSNKYSIYFQRIVYALFYVPICFIISLILLIISIITYPLVGLFYYVKTGNVENIPFMPWDIISKLSNFINDMKP